MRDSLQHIRAYVLNKYLPSCIVKILSTNANKSMPALIDSIHKHLQIIRLNINIRLDGSIHNILETGRKFV